jgi:hypothetical protein
MPREIWINAGAGETRAALLKDGVLDGYLAGSLLGPRGARLGDIYLGRAAKVMAALEAAFVEIGAERPGFLPLREVGGTLQEGAALAVVVTREAAGEKGARLSAKVAAAPPPGARPPMLLQPGPDVMARAIGAWADAQTEILIDDGRAAAAARAAFPQLRIAQSGADLFDAIEEQLAGLAAPRVMLPSGGFLTIERTRALTAIDVDSGGFQAAGGRAETARRINREAAREAGRQIRLRGLGGIMVIDFIQTDELLALAGMLRDSLGEPVEIAPVPALGLVTLARRHEALAAGTGFDAAARAVLRQIERSARAAPGRLLTVRAAPEVTALLAGAAVRAGLDRRGVGQVHYAAEVGRGGDFDVATG